MYIENSSKIPGIVEKVQTAGNLLNKYNNISGR
jgi:hypothetical protein